MAPTDVFKTIIREVAKADRSTRQYVLISCAVIGALILFDLVRLPFSSVHVEPGNFIELAKAAGMISAIYALSWIVMRRLIGDPSKIAAGIRRVALGLQNLALAVTIFIPFSFASGLFVYLGSATNHALLDAQFSAIDAALGFDWLAAVRIANSSAVVAWVLWFCYHAVGPLFFGIFLLLAFSPEPDAIHELIALLAVSVGLTGILMAAFPAAGAYAFYSPPPEIFSNFTGAGGLSHLQTLTALRSGEPFGFRVTAMKGLVSFPSFHAALGIIQVYCLRRNPRLMVPVGAVVAVMLPSTIPEGGHHLIDTIAGVAVGLVSIAAIRIATARRAKLTMEAAL
jgi:hypothetical protein